MKKVLVLFIVYHLSFNIFSQSISLDPNSLQLPRLAVNPTCAVADKGKMIYNTTQNKVLFCDGTAWIDPATGGVPNNWVNSGANSYLSDLNGKVGIGITSPVSALNIFNSTSANLYFHNNITGSTISDGFYVGNGGSTTGLIWNKENASIKIGTNDSEQITILGNGNVGLGYTAPSYRLSVNGTTYSNGIYVNGTTISEGTLTVNDVTSLNGTVDINGLSSNLNVDGNITTNSGKGIVRSNDANQLVIDEFATPANLSWTLAAGATTCCINMSFSTFLAPPSIAFGQLTGTSTNPDFITYTIQSMTNSSAQIRITNIGTSTSSANNAILHAMIIGRK